MRRGQVRIIGGEWRGRKLSIPEQAAVRPTPDRVRETLFNWLAPVIQGAYCLDLFAGSGALGFEALSRGAAEVVMVDQSAVVIKCLRLQCKLLKTTKALIYQSSIPQQWPVFSKCFDIVFLDPPYSEPLLLPVCFYLEEKGLLSSPAYIYLESRKEIAEDELPKGWQLIKQKKAGQVGYYLVKREGNT
ncbi:MAG TPA: 16S rRNA (guanine(966)-N(2))-methyltransferase RsmD, partial [Gammaproteobacteria bacterium]|nr:16S rRNA (guanine(966)-N(2))-methyltransferase RsmD [Gammaproteobacteria bacterium]